MDAWKLEARELIAQVDRAVADHVWPWSADDTEDHLCELSSYLERALNTLDGVESCELGCILPVGHTGVHDNGVWLWDDGTAKPEGLEAARSKSWFEVEIKDEWGNVIGRAPARSDVLDLTPQPIQPPTSRPDICPTCNDTGRVIRRPRNNSPRQFFDPCPNERWHNPGGEHYLTDQGDSAPVGESFNDSTGGAR